MHLRMHALKLAAVTATLLVAAQARAERLKFHFTAADCAGRTVLSPSGACAAPGERRAWYGGALAPACNPPHPTCYQPFQHPCTGQPVTLPLRLPLDSTPRIEHRYNRLIYNYGSDSVE